VRYIDEYVLGAIQAVVGPDTDRDLFSDRSRAARERLREVLDQARKNNQQARDLRRLVTLATETQDAANPRPMTVLLSNLTHAVMAEGGNPAYEKSPAVRLVLHQLLYLLDHSSLPAYDRDLGLWERDMRACEELLNISQPVPDRRVGATL